MSFGSLELLSSMANGRLELGIFSPQFLPLIRDLPLLLFQVPVVPPPLPDLLLPLLQASPQLFRPRLSLPQLLLRILQFPRDARDFLLLPALEVLEVLDLGAEKVVSKGLGSELGRSGLFGVNGVEPGFGGVETWNVPKELNGQFLRLRTRGSEGVGRGLRLLLLLLLLDPLSPFRLNLCQLRLNLPNPRLDLIQLRLQSPTTLLALPSCIVQVVDQALDFSKRTDKVAHFDFGLVRGKGEKGELLAVFRDGVFELLHKIRYRSQRESRLGKGREKKGRTWMIFSLRMNS
jgi:hypothetical protein